jgi:hypothetical protein
MFQEITVGYIRSTLTTNLKISTNLNRVLRIYLFSNSNIMKDFKLEDCKIKLQPLDEDDKFKMIYQWVKQEHITLAQFKMLVSYCC